MKNICILLSLVLLIQYLPAYGLENITYDSISISNTIETNKTDTVANTVSAEDSPKVQQTNNEKQELRKEKKKALMGLAVVGSVLIIFGLLAFIAWGAPSRT